MIASLLLLPTFIVGVYGPNVDHMPEPPLATRACPLVRDRRGNDDRAARVLPPEALDLTSSLR
ncbi:MAG: hypothetical protein ACR2GT_04375 [Gaiellaceae bacterium]